MAPAPGETVSTATGRKVDTRWEVVDASQLKQATGNLQNRDRQGRAASEAQIENIKGNLDAERLHSSPEADRGAPIVGSDDVVESGNARAEAIRRAYAQKLPQADAYRQMIERRGHVIPEGMPAPTLIRRRTTEMDDATRQAFVREANTPATMSLSASEEAKSDAAALTPETLGRLNPSLGQGVLAAGNRDFVRSWLSGLSEGERNRLTSDDAGGLSQDGARRLQAAIIAKAYGDPAVVKRLTESTDDNTKAISGALHDAAPLMATLRARIEAGQVPADLDISKQIMRAADLARVSREKGQSPGDILNSGDMFNPIDRTTGALVRAFHDPKMTRLAGRARVSDILRRYAQEALKQTTGDLAGGSKLDPAQFINAAINKASPETEAQGGLFGGSSANPVPQKQTGTEPPAPAGGVGSSGQSRAVEPPEPAPAPAPAPAPGAEPAVWTKNPGGDASNPSGHTLTIGAYRFEVHRNAGAAGGGVLGNHLYVESKEKPGWAGDPGIFTQGATRAELEESLRQTIASGHAEKFRTGEGESAAAEPAPAAAPVDDAAKARALQIKKLTATIKKEREHLAQVRQHFPNDPAIAKLAPQLARKEAQLAKLQAAAKAAEPAPAAPPEPAPAPSALEQNRQRQEQLLAQIRAAAAERHAAGPDEEAPAWKAANAEVARLKRELQTVEAEEDRLTGRTASEPAPAPAPTPEPPRTTPPPPAGPAPKTELGQRRAQAVETWLNKLAAAQGQPVANEAARIDLQRAAGQLDASQGKDGGATAAQVAWARNVADNAEALRTGAVAELPPPGFDPTVRGNVTRNAQETMRPSRYLRQVAEEAGVADPDAFTSLPAPVQVRRLQHALADKYGLAGIDIHPGANPRETIDQLADAHHNLQSMAAVMGVPNDTIGFGGQLRIWLGPRNAAEVSFGGGRALGVYRPDNRTIYMPGRSNSFAHEWTHALDDELVRRLSASAQVGELLSTHYVQSWTGAQRGPVHAFGQLMANIYGRDARTTLAYLAAQRQAMVAPTPLNQRILQAARTAYQASDFYRRAQRAGGARGAYLSQPYELLARSHEAYMSNRIGAAGGDTEFVAKPELVYLHEADRDLRSMYPRGDDRQRIFEAWDNLHAALRQGALYPNGPPAQTAPRNDLFGIGPNHWGQWASPQANPRLAAALRTQINGLVNQTSRWAEARERMGLPAPGEGTDPGYLTRTQRGLDALRLQAFSPRGMMHVIIARVPQAARSALTELLDHLTTDPGSARHIGETFEEESHSRTHRDINDYAAIVERNGIATSPERSWNPAGALRNATSLPRMSRAERDAVHEMLTQATALDGLPERIREAVRRHTINRLSQADRDTLIRHWDDDDAISVPASTPRLRKFASDLRFFLDRKYYELHEAGVGIPYMDGYFPRVFDESRIRANRDDFRSRGIRANAIRSERAIGDDGEALVARFRDRDVQEHLGQNAVDIINDEIRVARRQLRQNPLPAGQTPRPEDLVPDPDLRDRIHRAWATGHTDDWLRNIEVGHPTSFETRGPASNHLRERVLPPEADAILRPYLLTDPHAMIPAYAQSMNRRMAFTRRFGANGQEIDNLIERAVAGGMMREDADIVRNLTDMVTGRLNSGRGFRPVRLGLEYLNAAGTLSLMPRAAWTAMHEPMVALLRTGSVRDTFAGFAHMVGEIFQTGEAQRIAELAHYVGTVTSSVYESIQQHRTGATFTDSQALGPLMNNFYRRSLLTGATNMQRRGALVVGHRYLSRMAADLIDPNSTARERREASVALTELTIPPAEQEDFARWLAPYGRDAPDLSAVKDNRHGDNWRRAMYRLTNQMNQAPTTSEKAIGANSPAGKIVFGLMSFNYSFLGNVIERFINDANRQWREANGFGERAGVAGRLALHAGVGIVGLTLASLLGTVLRERAFNGDQWKKHQEDGDLESWLIDLAFQRTGLTGTLDPLLQLWHGLRYNKSVSDLALGASGGYYADAIQQIMGAFTRTSPHTNTSLFNAYRGAYNALAVPAAAVALSALPGGRLLGAAASAALMTVTSRQASNTFAETLAGPKGSGDETTAPNEEAPEPPEKDDEETKADHGSAAGNFAAGLVDDFLPMIGRGIMHLPGPARIVGGVGAGLYGAYRLHQEGKRFTEPPPEKRGVIR